MRMEEDDSEEELEDEKPKKKTKPKKKKKEEEEDEDDDDDDDDEEDDKKKKKSKSKPQSSAAANKRDLKPGEVTFEIGHNRFATVTSFRKETLVDIREFYEKDGKLLPGKKGISLKKAQWKDLLKLGPQINAALENM
jgi:hypothetical protein